MTHHRCRFNLNLLRSRDPFNYQPPLGLLHRPSGRLDLLRQFFALLIILFIIFMELSFRTIISLVHLIHLFIMRQWVNLSVFRHSWLRRGLFHRHHSYMHCYFESCPTQSLKYCLYCCRLPSQWRSNLRCLQDRSAQQVDRSCDH